MNDLKWRSYAAEIFGTFVPVFSGAMAVLFNNSIDVLVIALVFGLSVTAMTLRGKLTWKDFLFYSLSQLIDGFIASLLLLLITSQTRDLLLTSDSFAANDINSFFLSGSLPWLAPLLVEVLITFIFVFVILIVTDKKEYAKLAPLVIGLTLTILIVVGFNVTESSLNPARSLAAAIFAGGALAAFVKPLLIKEEKANNTY